MPKIKLGRMLKITLFGFITVLLTSVLMSQMVEYVILFHIPPFQCPMSTFMLLALLVLALPEGWNLTWDYDGSWIQPNETKRITLTLYASRLDVTRLTLHVTIYVQEVKVIEK